MLGALGGTVLLGVAGSTLGVSTAGASLPSTIKLYSIQDASGAAGAVGVDDEKAINLAIKNVNASHLLGSSKLSISYGDSATTPTQAANLATQAAAGKYPVVIGPPSSGTAVAVAPILSRASIPTVFTQAGGPGTLISKYMFRMTPLQTTRIHQGYKWVQSKKVKTMAVLYDSTFPTEVTLYKETVNDGPHYGFKVVGSVGVQAAQSNISSAITRLLSYHAQSLAIFVVLTQNGTAATGIKQGGFSGPILAEDGAGGGSLSGAGSAANGIVWASDWVSGAPFGPISTAYAKAYKTAYGVTSTNWAAESYTALMYIAKALKAAGSTTAAAVQKALTTEGKGGYAGVLGKHITVVNGQQNAKPVLVQWLNGKEVPLANQNP